MKKKIYRCEICNTNIISPNGIAPTKLSKILNVQIICCKKCIKINAEPYWAIVNLGVVFKYKTIDDIPQYTIDIITSTLKVKGFDWDKYFEDIKKAREEKDK